MTQAIISTGWAQAGDEDLTESAEQGAVAEVRHWRVEPHDQAQRLDKTLAAWTPGFSRSWLQQLIADGHVWLNGQACTKAAARLKVGDELRATLHMPAHVSAFAPEPMALQVRYEDAQVLVLDKPAGLVVHPGAGNWSGTLLNGLLAYHHPAQHLPRAGIVHRLDKDTSGLMVVGKTHEACAALSQQIAARHVQRIYVALVHRRMTQQGDFEIQGFMGRDARHRLRMAVVRPDVAGAREAKTRVRVLDTDAHSAWVGCKLHTGRTHQIRVHLASVGHPLVGDVLYGGQPLWGLQRQALHAHRLAFVHPTEGTWVQVSSPVPADLASAVCAAGLNYNLEQLWQTGDALAASTFTPKP